MNPHSNSGMAISLSLLGCLAGACASSPDAAGRWTASASTDPITGVERCVVTIPDRRFGSAFSRTGVVYPFIERNSELGLMVGVSSGGQIRLPTGDIEWRVDNNPHHTLQAADTPSSGVEVPSVVTSKMDKATLEAFERSMSDSEGVLFSIQNGVTAASGDKATKLLEEMRAGTELRFRSKSSAPTAGLTSASTYRTGRIENGEFVPFLLDESFEVALGQCGL